MPLGTNIRMGLAVGIVLAAGPAVSAEFHPEAAMPCRFTLEVGPTTTGADGKPVENWLLVCHRLPLTDAGRTTAGRPADPPVTRRL